MFVEGQPAGDRRQHPRLWDRRGRSFDAHLAAGVARPDFRLERPAAQDRVDRCGHVVVYGHPLAVLDLDQDVERRRRPALQHRFLGAAPAGLLIAQRHALDAADQIRKGGVDQEVLQRDAVGGAHQLDPAFGDCARRRGLQLAADLVDDDDLRHVVFDRLDHNLVLELRPGHLHPPGLADGRMGDVAVPADLVGGVHHDHPGAFAQDAGGLAQQRGLADARPAQQQDALPGLGDVFDDVDDAVDGASHAAGQADDAPLPVANTRDAMQGALDARAVITGELADAGDHVAQILFADLAGAQPQLVIDETRFGQPAQIHDDFQQVVALVRLAQGPLDRWGQHLQQSIQVIRDVTLLHK